MNIEIEGKKYSCPVEVAMEKIAGKWKILIIWHLRNKTRRFGDLRRKIPGVTQKMLTQQLRELEKDGIVRRKVYAEVPPKVEYSLTDEGKELEPVLMLLLKWGNEYAKSHGFSDYEVPESLFAELPV